MVKITHEQIRLFLDRIMHEQTIICWQLFAGHVVSPRPIKRKEKLHWMIMTFERTGHSWNSRRI